jgi:hypothetical protein
MIEAEHKAFRALEAENARLRRRDRVFWVWLARLREELAAARKAIHALVYEHEVEKHRATIDTAMAEAEGGERRR